MNWLCTTTDGVIQTSLKEWNSEGLNDYEKESIQQLDWFRGLCQRVRSSRNFPDAFHLWTAERAGQDYFLTLDGRFVRMIESIRNEKKTFPLKTKVMTIRAFLKEQGVAEKIAIPISYGEPNTIAATSSKLRDWPYDLSIV